MNILYKIQIKKYDTQKVEEAERISAKNIWEALYYVSETNLYGHSGNESILKVEVRFSEFSGVKTLLITYNNNDIALLEPA